MTVTEDVPTAASAPPEPAAPAPAASGLAAVLGSGDHKVVGRLWMVASLVHLVLVGLAAIATAAEKIDTSTLDVVGDDWFAQVFTFRSIGGAFLFRSEEHTSELQSLMRISYAVFCLKK